MTHSHDIVTNSIPKQSSGCLVENFSKNMLALNVEL